MPTWCFAKGRGKPRFFKAAFGGALLWIISPEANLFTAFGCGLASTVFFAFEGEDLGAGVGDPVTAHLTFGVTSNGAVVGHGMFECTKMPASSMKADSVIYTLQFSSDGDRMDGTVEITSSTGNINEKIMFERR